MVFRRTKVARTTFRKLPQGALYWLSTAVNVAPSIKVGRHAKAGALASGAITQTAVADATVAVVRVPAALVG